MNSGLRGLRCFYLKYRNFRAQKLSRTETFAHINFREFEKFAKVYVREFFKTGPFAKVNEREKNENRHLRKYMNVNFPFANVYERSRESN